MNIKKVDDRPQAKGGYQRAKSNDSAGQIADKGAESIGADSAPEVGDMRPLLRYQQGNAVIRRHAHTGALIKGYSKAGYDNANHYSYHTQEQLLRRSKE